MTIIRIKQSSDYSTAVEFTPQNREVVGLIPAGYWAFSHLYAISSVALNRSLEEMGIIVFSYLKNESLAVQLGVKQA